MSSLDRILPFLRPIEDLLVDPTVTEVMVNAGGRRVFVERTGTLERVPDRTLEVRNLTVAIKNIARACGDEISEQQPSRSPPEEAGSGARDGSSRDADNPDDAPTGFPEPQVLTGVPGQRGILCGAAHRAARERQEAAWAKQRQEAERWRNDLRPRAIALIAARTRTLSWSRAIITLLLDEFQTDDLFVELVGRVDRLATTRYPQAVAVALAIRHSWNRDDLTRVAKRLGIKITTKQLADVAPPARSLQRTQRTFQTRGGNHDAVREYPPAGPASRAAA